jgi:hypothetical protein
MTELNNNKKIYVIVHGNRQSQKYVNRKAIK